MTRLESDPHAGTLAEALRARGLDPGVAEAIRPGSRSAATTVADDLDASVLTEGAGAFGDFERGRSRAATTGSLGSSPPGLEAVRSVRVGVARGMARARGQGGPPGGGAVADAAVIAVPASLLPSIAFDPPLPPGKAAVRYGQAAKLFVGLCESGATEPDAVSSPSASGATRSSARTAPRCRWWARSRDRRAPRALEVAVRPRAVDRGACAIAARPGAQTPAGSCVDLGRRSLGAWRLQRVVPGAIPTDARCTGAVHRIAVLCRRSTPPARGTRADGGCAQERRAGRRTATGHRAAVISRRRPAKLRSRSSIISRCGRAACSPSPGSSP